MIELKHEVLEFHMTHPFQPAAVEHLAHCARIAYRSEGVATPEKDESLCRRLLFDVKHESVFEHVGATAILQTDRGLSHEIVRHRLCAFTQESTRYCNYGAGKFDQQIRVVRPGGIEEGSEAHLVWRHACLTAEMQYMNLLKAGQPAQMARSVLPTCLATRIAVTANLREWRHILKLRTGQVAGSKPHPDIVGLMRQVLSLFRQYWPVFFEDFQ